MSMNKFYRAVELENVLAFVQEHDCARLPYSEAGAVHFGIEVAYSEEMMRVTVRTLAEAKEVLGD